MKQHETSQQCSNADLVLTYLSGFLSSDEENKARQHFRDCPCCQKFFLEHKKEQRIESERSPLDILNIHNSTLFTSVVAGILLFFTGFLQMYYDYKLANESLTILLIGSTIKLLVVGIAFAFLGSFVLWYKKSIRLHYRLSR